MSQDKSKKYVFLRSDDSADVYPSNTAYHFKTHLNSPMVVRQGCEVGLSEFHCVDDLSGLQTELCIHSNICKESVLQTKDQSVLRIIYPEANTHINFITCVHILMKYVILKST